MFSVAMVCLFVCISVSLPFSNITQNVKNGLLCNFVEGSMVVQETSE